MSAILERFVPDPNNFYLKTDTNCFALYNAILAGKKVILPEDMPEIPQIANLESKILKKINENPSSFHMRSWQGGKYYCRGGFAILVGGEKAMALVDYFKTAENKNNWGVAAILIYAHNTSYVPDFCEYNSDALEDIKRRAQIEKENQGRFLHEVSNNFRSFAIRWTGKENFPYPEWLNSGESVSVHPDIPGEFVFETEDSLDRIIIHTLKNSFGALATINEWIVFTSFGVLAVNNDQYFANFAPIDVP